MGWTFYNSSGQQLRATADKAATNAEMATPSSTTVFATPDNLDHHPAVAKAWANIAADGGSLSQNFGCSGISKVTTGHYRTVIVAMAASNVFFGATNSAGSDDIVTFNMSANTQLDSYLKRGGSATDVGHAVMTMGAFA